MKQKFLGFFVDEQFQRQFSKNGTHWDLLLFYFGFYIFLQYFIKFGKNLNAYI